MKHLKRFKLFEGQNDIDILEDMDRRLQGNVKWESFVNDQFDELSVDNWFDWYHQGGDFEKAMSYGERLSVGLKESVKDIVRRIEDACPVTLVKDKENFEKSKGYKNLHSSYHGSPGEVTTTTNVEDFNKAIKKLKEDGYTFSIDRHRHNGKVVALTYTPKKRKGGRIVLK